MPDFVTNRTFQNPADKDISLDSKLVTGDTLKKIGGAGVHTSLPTSFDLVPRQQMRAIRFYLGERAKKVVQPKDIKEFMDDKFKEEIQKLKRA